MVRSKSTVAAFVLVACISVPSGQCATYYIDSEFGKDTSSGLLPDPVVGTITSGPWRTLGRLATATLSPGDQVLLRCGRNWTETLRIGQSGTHAAPIRIGSYPSGCDVRPLIQGATTIPSQAWSTTDNKIWTTSVPFNLVPNGTLDKTISGWNHWSIFGDHSMSYLSACPLRVTGCLTYRAASQSWGLATSPTFPVSVGQAYIVKFSAQANPGTRFGAAVRRGVPPYDNLATWNFTADGTWQTLSLSIPGGFSTPLARFDLYVPDPGSRIHLREVFVGPSIAQPGHLFAVGFALRPAHHPNIGYDPMKPNSAYLSNAEDADNVTTPHGLGSTYVNVGSDLVLPPGRALSAGLTVHLRSENWNLDRRTLAGSSGSRLILDRPTMYPFRSKWGWFLSGARWMLDSPGEWSYDAGASTLSVWMPDGSRPNSRLAISQLNTGIDLSSMSNVVVDGVAVRGTTTGISLRRAVSAIVRNTTIEDVGGEGIDVKASRGCSISNVTIARTGLDAISGTSATTVNATGLSVENSLIAESAVRFDGQRVLSLPGPSRAAIDAGTDATVRGNSVSQVGYLGIRAYGVSVIDGNVVTKACLSLDDCGGIYVSYTANGTSITNNLVDDVRGNANGTPYVETRTAAIYVDERARDITVMNNTLVDADYGIHVHNAAHNLIQGNVAYGNRRFQIWMQEQSAIEHASGDVVSNTIRGNLFFPTTSNPSVQQESELGTTQHFASFAANVYSALLSPKIVSELWPTASAGYTFPQWQAATINGVTRANDLAGRVVSPSGYAAFSSTGVNIVPNGDLSSGRAGWGTWNQTPPFGSLLLETCTIGPCLRVIAGSTVTLATSPNFSVVKDQWYRVSFDARTLAVGQSFAVLARRGGGGTAGYDRLMSAPETFIGNSLWTRYSFTFKSQATVTANDPTTNELGARVDFFNILPGQSLQLANLEMVPLSPVDAGLKTAILLNSSPSREKSFTCPDEPSNPMLCPQYVRFTDATRVYWPLSLPPLGREIIYTQNRALLDSDGDGVPDSQDRCAETAVGMAVRANGCAMSQ